MAFKLDDLVTKISKLAFPPAPVRVRIIVAGLAYCTLSKGVSGVNFLQHVPDHELSLTLLKRRAGSPPHDRKDFTVPERDILSVRVESPVELDSYESANGAYLTVRKMINLNLKHAKKLVHRPDGSGHKRARLSLHDCAFHTVAVYPEPLSFVESTATTLPAPEEIGYILGGEIGTLTNTGRLIVSSTDNSIDDTYPGKDDGGDLFYDLIFNNHCTSSTKCKQQVGIDPITGLEGTDFKFYYELFKEQGSSRKFDLKRFRETANKDKDSIEVAACNPIVTDPPEW